ncbi:TPA: MAE_28990/MAE_18760 family HEPN-like nuclease [Yersinia enterocolitica]
MQLVKDLYDERVADIESYFELVNNVELAIGSGGAIFSVNGTPYQINPDQQKIMYSGVYLHLYNLVESTISMLIDAVERHAIQGINGQLILLTEKMKKLYVKSVAAPFESINNDLRLEKALELFDQVLNIRPLELKIPPGGGGNWDLKEIERISKSIGVDVTLPRALRTKVNTPFRDDKGPIRLVKEIRNKLAHGSLSFTQCGTNHVASDFRRLIDIIKEYLTHIISSYENFITAQGYKIAQ